MDTVVNNLDNRGGKIKGVGDVLQGGGADSTYFLVLYVGDDPPHGTVHWGVST